MAATLIRPRVGRREPTHGDSRCADVGSGTGDSGCGILIVTDRRFWNRSIGSETRIANLLSHLARRREPIVVAYVGRLRRNERAALDAFRHDAARDLTILARRPEWRTVGATLARSLRSLWPFRAVPGRIPESGPLSSPLRSPSARRRFVETTIRTTRPRIVLVEFTRLAALVHPRPVLADPAPQYLLDTHDILARRVQPRSGSEGAAPADPWIAASAFDEIRALEGFDVLIAIQGVEGALLRRQFPDKPVLVVPHGLDLPECPPSPCSSGGPIRLGFLGGRDPANAEALDWFVETVWPTLHARFGARIAFDVGGQICRRWTKPPSGIRLVGTVDSIGDFWPKIDLAVNPVRSGSGLKIKNVEALAHGRALVTTSIGAEGLESASPDGLRIANGPDEWISTLADWIASPASARRTARHGRAFFEAHLSADRAFAELDAYLDRTLSHATGGAGP